MLLGIWAAPRALISLTLTNIISSLMSLQRLRFFHFVRGGAIYSRAASIALCLLREFKSHCFHIQTFQRRARPQPGTLSPSLLHNYNYSPGFKSRRKGEIWKCVVRKGSPWAGVWNLSLPYWAASAAPFCSLVHSNWRDAKWPPEKGGSVGSSFDTIARGTLEMLKLIITSSKCNELSQLPVFKGNTELVLFPSQREHLSVSKFTTLHRFHPTDLRRRRWWRWPV